MSNFKAVITEDSTKITGKISEILTGLAMYIRALSKNDIPETMIREVVDLAFLSFKEKN